MSISQSEIEAIVRTVLAKLASEGNSAPLPITSAKVASSPHRLALHETVISTQLLKNRLTGIAVLQLAPQAVVTPAVRDLCKSLNIVIERVGSETPAAITEKQATAPEHVSALRSVPGQRMLVAGTVDWMEIVAGQLCRQQTRVIPTLTDDASVVREIASSLRAEQRTAIAIVGAPHAACWQASRDEALRPAVVANWGQLDEILAEVPANVLFVSARTWQAPMVCNLARKWQSRLK